MVSFFVDIIDVEGIVLPGSNEPADNSQQPIVILENRAEYFNLQKFSKTTFEISVTTELKFLLRFKEKENPEGPLLSDRTFIMMSFDKRPRRCNCVDG